MGIITLGLVHYLLSSLPQEREGGKGESGTSKTYFFTDFGMDEIEKVIKNSKRLHLGLLYIGLLLVSFVQSQFKCNNDAYRKANLSTILE